MLVLTVPETTIYEEPGRDRTLVCGEGGGVTAAPNFSRVGAAVDNTAANVARMVRDVILDLGNENMVDEEDWATVLMQVEKIGKVADA